MICYVIKNKEDKYLCIDELKWYFTAIENASNFNDYNLALCYCPSNCKVVKAEIKEIEE